MSGGSQATIGPQKAKAAPERPLQQPAGRERQERPPALARGHTPPAADGRQVVRVIPGLFPESWRRGMMQPLRVWYLLRALDRDASGRLDKRETLDLLQRLGWSQASAYRLIGKGMGTFWREETTYPHGTHGHKGTSPRKTLVLVGVKSLATSWGLELLSRHQVEVPWELRAGGVAAWNSLAYHAWLPGPRPPRISRNGQVQKPRRNHPYSRAKIRDDTGVSERTQIRHQALLLPGTRRKVTRKQANYATHREELRSKRHRSWCQKRLGNSYTSNLSRGAGGKAGRSTGSRAGFGPMRVTQPSHPLLAGLAASLRRPRTSSAPARRIGRCTRTRCCAYPLLAGMRQ